MQRPRAKEFATFLYVAGLLILSSAPAKAQEGAELQLPISDGCITCHTEEDYLPDGLAAYDVHLQAGLSCAGCHGGNPNTDDYDEAMSEDAGFIGVPDREDIPAMCGKCHSDLEFMREYQPGIRTDQVSSYWVSVHGQKLRQGDKKVADCSSCHTAHSIAPASDPRSTVYPTRVPETCHNCHSDAEYMAEYGIPTNQYDRYVKSVHGVKLLEDEDLGAPACNDCHGNHGAVPPDVESLEQVCGSCHVNNQSFFENSPMEAPFREDELHACLECHGYHDVAKTFDDMVGIGPESVCMNCHSEGEDAYDVAETIRSQLMTLTAASDSASTMQSEVVRIGMDDVDIEYLLKQAHQSLVQARTLVHTFDPEKVGEAVNDGTAKAREAIETSKAEIQDNKNRRLGFGLASLFITLLVVGLYLKIREVDARTSF